ncbi:MAG TPA: hypothetical protein VNW73_15155 [Ktedonobacteraceae bacterium]|nr:hypothetical protein [Ktedonobacteraceae bacterium]
MHSQYPQHGMTPSSLFAPDPWTYPITSVQGSGVVHDLDTNAALNILAERFSVTAYGESHAGGYR